MEYIYNIDSPLGVLTVSSDGVNITGLWIERSRYFGSTIKPGAEIKSLPVFKQAEKWLDIYFSGSEPNIKLPLAPVGTQFRQKVWQLLMNIPYGTVTTYGAIAKQISEGKKDYRMAAQAIGGAVGHNPISIIIPCHRVVGSNGSLTGYGGGINKKVQLLQLEKVNMDKLYIPSKGTAL